MKKIIQYEDPIWCDDRITASETLGEVLKSTIDLIELYGENAKVEFSGECDLYLIKEREETDSEYKSRLKQEQKKAEKERKEYERLKAKFGDK